MLIADDDSLMLSIRTVKRIALTTFFLIWIYLSVWGEFVPEFENKFGLNLGLLGAKRPLFFCAKYCNWLC